MSQRISVTLTEEIADALEDLASDVGLTRTTYAAYVLGSHVKQAQQLEPVKQEIAKKVGDLFTPEMMEQIAKQESESTGASPQ